METILLITYLVLILPFWLFGCVIDKHDMVSSGNLNGLDCTQVFGNITVGVGWPALVLVYLFYVVGVVIKRCVNRSADWLISVFCDKRVDE